jgi:hypothetical protein
LYHTYIFSYLNIHTRHLESGFLPSQKIVPCGPEGRLLIMPPK